MSNLKSTTLPAAPMAEQVRGMLSCLFGPRTTVRALTQWPRNPGKVYLAEYVRSPDETAAYVTCDFAFAVAGGAALTLIPPRTAAEMISQGQIPDAVFDNCKEVLNVCVSFFSDTTNERLRLGNVTLHPKLEGIPSRLANKSFICEVAIDQYPKGVLQFSWNG